MKQKTGGGGIEREKSAGMTAGFLLKDLVQFRANECIIEKEINSIYFTVHREEEIK